MNARLINKLLKKYLDERRIYEMKTKFDWVNSFQGKQLSFEDILKGGIAYIKGFSFKDLGFDQSKEMDVNINLLKGNLAFELGAHKQALDHFKIVLEEDSNNMEAWFKVGLIYFLLRHYKAALGCVNKILLLEPKLNYALILKGIILEELGNEEAIQYYEKAFFTELVDSELIMAVNSILFNYLNKQEKILEILDKLIKKYPDHPKIHFLIFNKGIFLYNLERYNEALDCLDRLENKSNHISALFIKANIFEELETYDEADSCFDQILAHNPKDFKAWFLKGNLLNKRNQKEQALDCYNKAIELKPDYIDALNNKGLIFQDFSKLEEALELFNKAIEFDPEYYLAYFNKACVLKQLNQNEAAIKNFTKVIELNPFEIDSYYNRACLLKELGKFEEAIKDYKNVLELDNEDIEALLGMGMAYIDLHNYSKAIDCMKKALKIDPNHKKALDLLNKIRELKKLSS